LADNSQKLFFDQFPFFYSVGLLDSGTTLLCVTCDQSFNLLPNKEPPPTDQRMILVNSASRK
jgi:hypothetical protein